MRIVESNHQIRYPIYVGTPPSCTGLTFQINEVQWFGAVLEEEALPRRLCYSAAQAAHGINSTWQYTGFKMQPVWDCDATRVDGGCAQMPASGVALEPVPTAVRRARTVCCRRLASDVAAQFTVGQCVNPHQATCCGGGAVPVAGGDEVLQPVLWPRRLP